MTSANAWRAERRLRLSALTDLNREVSARYHACVKAGGHTPSEERVNRDHGGRLVQLKVCRSCGVPITSANGWANAMAAARRGRERG